MKRETIIQEQTKTFSMLSTKYWIIGAHEEIMDWEREHATCKRRKARQAEQIMAPLPSYNLFNAITWSFCSNSSGLCRAIYNQARKRKIYM